MASASPKTLLAALTDGAVIIFGTRGATATEKSQQKHSYVAANFKYVVRQGAPALASLDPNVTPTAPAAKPAGPTQQPITPMSSQQEPSSQDDADGRLTPAAAAARLGYTDVNSSFFRDDATGARTAVTYAAHEQLPPELSSRMVPYESLRAFETTDGRGYGVCCTRALQEGDLIGEYVGRCLSDAQYAALEDKNYVVSFEDEVLASKRAAGDDVLYIDAKEEGNMMRLFNDDHRNPNCELMYWPKVEAETSGAAGSSSAAAPPLPRRAFLVARTAVPPFTELTWNYGRHYPRPWLRSPSSGCRGGGCRDGCRGAAAAGIDRRGGGRPRRRVRAECERTGRRGR